MTTKVLVFGAGGYIGEGVAAAFRRQGYIVYGVIRNEKKSSQLLKREIIPVIGDQNNLEALKTHIEQSAIVVDAIGMNSLSAKTLEYILQIKSSTPSHRPLYIFTSGIMTYGPDHPGLVDETTAPNIVDTVMKERKEFEDKVLSVKSIRAVVVRPGFVYGGQGGPIADWFFDIKNGDELVLIGRKEKRWSWVHVDDLGEAYVNVAKAGTIVDGQLFNVAEPHGPTYEELKFNGARVAGWKDGKVKHIPIVEELKHVEPTVLINPQKAWDLLHWKPSHLGILNEMELYYHSWKGHKTN